VASEDDAYAKRRASNEERAPVVVAVGASIDGDKSWPLSSLVPLNSVRAKLKLASVLNPGRPRHRFSRRRHAPLAARATFAVYPL
jgi:hypothetical protein